jgi:LCP family protein required for cell wall assembly
VSADGRRVVAGSLSAVAPGAGQAYVGAVRRGLVLLVLALVPFAALTAMAFSERNALLDAVFTREALGVILVADLGLLALRSFAVVDAWRLGGRSSAGTGVLAVAALSALLLLTAAPHAAVAYYGVRGYDALNAVFAETEPRDRLPASGIFLIDSVRSLDPLRGDAPSAGAANPEQAPVTPYAGEELPLEPSRAGSVLRRGFVFEPEGAEGPWLTLLLIGSDAGPERPGNRTDTMIVVAFERGTGRAAALGVPRNLVRVPLAGVASRSVKRFPEALNSLYDWALAHPDLFPGGADPGATALKQTISKLLGIRIDYYAMVDLDGFVDMVDALGGVTIHVKERIVDSVTRPAWGETKPRIDVMPGRTYHFSGRTALAYVRSRKASSDYRRMGRQRCFLSAVADQLDVKAVLLNFGRLASIAKESVRTDIPLDRVPDLLRLAAGVDSELTATETFGSSYVKARRPRDGYPIPAIERMREAVRDIVLSSPAELAERRGIGTTSATC